MLALLVEDQIDLAELVYEYLETEQIECDLATDGSMAWQLTQQNQYDVVILDINLPKMDGYQVCQKLRDINANVPIIMLTANDALEQKLTGFKAGADDYLVKPFALEELVMRIKAISKRQQQTSQLLQIADLQLNSDTKQIFRGTRPVQLSPIGFSLLELLMRHSPKVVSRSQIEDSNMARQTLALNWYLQLLNCFESSCC